MHIKVDYTFWIIYIFSTKISLMKTTSKKCWFTRHSNFFIPFIADCIPKMYFTRQYLLQYHTQYIVLYHTAKMTCLTLLVNVFMYTFHQRYRTMIMHHANMLKPIPLALLLHYQL